MIHIFSQRVYDEFHLELIEISKNLLKSNFSIYYDHGFLSDKILDQVSKDTNYYQVIVLADFLEDGDQFIIGSVQRLNALADNNPQKMFLVITSVSGRPSPRSNVKFLHAGSDMMFQSKQYPAVLPQAEKTITNKHWISLSHGAPKHRIMSAAVLMGHELDHYGLLRIAPDDVKGYSHWSDYYTFTHSLSCVEIIQHGFKRLQEGRHGGQPAGHVYQDIGPANNSVNFDLRLRHLYQHSLVEIVNETTFFSSDIFVTEKFLNSVYGFNLPIVMSNLGTVAYLRQHGFDMFDDVIDHTYDTVHDPLDRIITAINSNYQLLSNKEHAQKAWDHCYHRLTRNYEYARDSVYTHFKQYFTNQLVGCTGIEPVMP